VYLKLTQIARAGEANLQTCNSHQRQKGRMQFQGVLVASLNAVKLLDVLLIRAVLLVGVEIRILHAIPVQSHMFQLQAGLLELLRYCTRAGTCGYSTGQQLDCRHGGDHGLFSSLDHRSGHVPIVN
jgi:hypothetical protein